MSAEEAISRLLKIHPKGFDLSLDRITELLEKLDNPHLKIPPVFHVAGTNGKGSTSAFLRAILEAAGKSVHVHTSPHLVHWNERYRLGSPKGGEFVSDEKLEQAILRAETANGGKSITVFEIMSAVAFLLFSQNPADYCIIEVGLGGRFDATNVLQNPIACLITPIGLDHEAYLGDTIGKIAFEKAGIIKQHIPVFVGEQDDDARDVIETRAHELQAPIQFARQDFDYYEQAGRFIYQDENGLLDLPKPRLSGRHQMANAALAISAIRHVLPDLENDIYERAMENVVWPGRFERLPKGKLTESLSAGSKNIDPETLPEIWIDGGHNPQAGQAIAGQLLRQVDNVKTVMIVGMLTTKEPNGFFKAFNGLVEEIICVPVNQSDAGFDPEKLAEIVASTGLKSSSAKSVEEALHKCTEIYDTDIRILICGSLYLVGEVLEKNGTPPS